MKCLKCDEEKPLRAKAIKEDGQMIGFCGECWKEVDQSGKCIHCGVEEDLFIQAVWGGRIIEHICGYCRATEGNHGG